MERKQETLPFYARLYARDALPPFPSCDVARLCVRLSHCGDLFPVATPALVAAATMVGSGMTTRVY